MIPKRVKQFYVNVTDKMTKKDYDYAKEILNSKELELFMKLSKSEQKHSIRIAKDIEFTIDNKEIKDEEILKNKNILVKSALLHDIGKITKRLNVIDKSVIVILNKLTNGKLKKMKKSKKIQCYYNHSSYGYEILKDMIDNEIILDIVKNHHSDETNNVVSFFKQIDDKN